MEELINDSIKFAWDQKDPNDSERVGAMYCFKRCDVNQT